MHAEKLLHRWLLDVLPNMHKRRLGCLGVLISSAMMGGLLTVTGLGRSIQSLAKEKHNIKRADRLLSNKKLQGERLEIYKSLSERLLGEAEEPLILVDWSNIDEGQKFFLLRAATPLRGRSLTLYEEVHDVSTKEKPKTHKAFLRQLKTILPKNCKPIIVTDAGFRTPWFKEVRALGWDFIGRVRNRDKVQLQNKKSWIGAKSLYSQARSIPKCLGEVLLTCSNAFPCRLVLYKAMPKGRVHLTKVNKKARYIRSARNADSGREPWLLATSLSSESASARQVVRPYVTRMQIEESFRDLKCPRFGLRLDYTGTYKIERLKVLILIGSMTAVFAWLLGKASELFGTHRQFQASSTKNKTVLSSIFIGIRIFRKKLLPLSVKTFDASQQLLKKTVSGYAI